ncbi:MAG TPA: indolepyruvate oxidoreductase subunit beta family protein [Methylomirabilota bacterium]|nr:indolepyruvate oxidoreductase subunit beta family protein [Methylomirabilota bacterium]
MAPRRPISILIAALGGQGGGVLTEWIAGAAAHAGLPAQATSIPGVAQRTGATTYYLEVYPEPIPSGAPEPVFSLYPTPGDVDVVMASELLEAGRTLETDYASPERTTMIASTHRLFAIGEKTVLGDGIFPRERVEDAARKLAKRLIAFDGLAAAQGAGSEVNAVLLGALCAAEILPLGASSFEAAIREGGVAVERNLAGFKAGMEIVASGGDRTAAPAPAISWEQVKAERAHALGLRMGDFLELVRCAEEEFPAPLHRTLGEALARLIDYQDARYARGYLGRVRTVLSVDPDMAMTEIFARRLAVWMTYEDAIRVADLKTRGSRFERIRRDHGAANGKVLHVTDYLKPDLDEIYGILPAVIAAPIARLCERWWPERRPSLGQHVKTTAVTGFLRVWVLGRLRVIRPWSLRARREFVLIDRWQQTVLECAALDLGLAREVADIATVVRGYGDVRRRLSHAFERVLDEILTEAVARDEKAGQGYERARRIVSQTRQQLLADEKGLEQAMLAAGA